jgi:hypothetical protein
MTTSTSELARPVHGNDNLRPNMQIRQNHYVELYTTTVSFPAATDESISCDLHRPGLRQRVAANKKEKKEKSVEPQRSQKGDDNTFV